MLAIQYNVKSLLTGAAPWWIVGKCIFWLGFHWLNPQIFPSSGGQDNVSLDPKHR